jgi:hypothetical protein
LETGDSEAGNRTTVDLNIGVMVKDTTVEMMAADKVMMSRGIFLFHR